MPPLIQWPPQGSEKAQWAKDEHIKGCQPLTRTNLIWLHKDQTELIEQFEFHPNIRWDDGVDAFSQSLDYWPALMSEAEMVEHAKTEEDYIGKHIGILPISAKQKKPFNEREWLSQLNATGYRQHIQGDKHG